MISTRARHILYRANLNNRNDIELALQNGLRLARGCGIKTLTELYSVVRLQPEQNIGHKYNIKNRKKHMTYDTIEELMRRNSGLWERSEKDDRKDFLTRRQLLAYRQVFGNLSTNNIKYIKAPVTSKRREEPEESGQFSYSGLYVPQLPLDDSPSITSVPSEPEFTGDGGRFGGAGASGSWDDSSSSSSSSPDTSSSSSSDSCSSGSDSSSSYDSGSSSGGCDSSSSCGSSTD